MTDLSPQQAITDKAQENTAWVSIEIPVTPGKLFNYLQDTQRLFRLNPYLDIGKWDEISAGKQFHLEALNEMNGVAYNLVVTVESIRPCAGMFLSYDKGLKRALEITLQPSANGSILTLREHYHAASGSAENQAELLKEVDQGLVHWASSIRQYLLGLERWGKFWPYRWYKERFWLGMRPTHRRIARMLCWVTLLEFVVFLFIFAIYWNELARQ